MAMSVSGGNGKKRPMAEINVTPMVDVMLVLLVIFMIAAPSIKEIEGMQVNLPQVRGEPGETIVVEDAYTLQVKADGSVIGHGKNGDTRFDGDSSLATLVEDLKLYKDDCEKGKKTPVIVIAGDGDVRWQRILQVWNSARIAGITQVSFQFQSAQRQSLSDASSER